MNTGCAKGLVMWYYSRPRRTSPCTPTCPSASSPAHRARPPVSAPWLHRGSRAPAQAARGGAAPARRDGRVRRTAAAAGRERGARHLLAVLVGLELVAVARAALALPDPGEHLRPAAGEGGGRRHACPSAGTRPLQTLLTCAHSKPSRGMRRAPAAPGRRRLRCHQTVVLRWHCLRRRRARARARTRGRSWPVEGDRALVEHAYL
jgi:hypothetical protein